MLCNSFGRAFPRAGRTVRSSRIALLAGGLLVGGAVMLAPLPAFGSNTWDGGGGGSFLWSNALNWNLDTPPSYGTLTFAGSIGTTNVMDQNYSMNQIQWTGSSAWTMNSSNGAVLSLFDNGGTQAKIESNGTGGVTINAPITFAATQGNNWGEINAVNSALTFASGTLTVSGSAVNGIRMFGAGQTTTFNNTVSASGKYFSTSAVNTTVAIGGSFTSGDFYLMNGGTLRLNAGGAMTTSALRLGGDLGTTGTQDLTRGATFQLASTTGGQTFANTINTVSGNTSGALQIQSLNTSGTNTISGGVFLDSALSTTVAGGGTLAFTGSFDVKSQTLTIGGAGNTTIASLASSNAAGGSLVKTGAGTLTLTGTGNTYTGTSPNSLNVNGTQINQGTLAIVADSSLGLAPANAYNNIQFTGSATIQNNASGPLNIAGTRNISIGSGATATFTNLTSSGNLTVAGLISGSGAAVVVNGPGIVTLTGATSSYTGGTTVLNGGTLATTSLPTASGSSSTIGTGNLTLDNGTLSYIGASNVTPFFNRTTTLGAGGGTIQVVGGTTLTVSGSIQGSGSLTKTGAGSLTLTANSPYTGATVISAGTLALAGASTVLTGTSGVTVNSGGTLLFSGTNQINQATLPGISLNGGTIDAGGNSQGTGGTSLATPGTAGLGALTLQANSIIDLTSTSVLHFTVGSGTWTGVLTINNWSGTVTLGVATGGGAEQILFGTNPTNAFTGSQLSQIQFVNPAGLAAGTYAAVFAATGTGEIVPGAQVPEPTTVAAGLLALGALGWTQRRRLRAWLPARG